MFIQNSGLRCEDDSSKSDSRTAADEGSVAHIPIDMGDAGAPDAVVCGVGDDVPHCGVPGINQGLRLKGFHYVRVQGTCTAVLPEFLPSKNIT